MNFSKIFMAFALILSLMSFTNLSYGADKQPICTAPDCIVYSVTNPIDGVKLNVSDWGAKNPKAPTILFIHGFPHDQFLWLGQINNELMGNYRVVTMDLRGFGLSNKPEVSTSYNEQLFGADINAVLTALNIDNVVLVAHSAGGVAAISYIKQFGESKLRGLVLTDAIADNGVFPFIPGSVFGLIVQGATAATADDLMLYTQNFLTLSTFQPLEPGLNNFMLARDLLMPQAPRLALINSLGSFNLNALSTLQTKALVVWGANDSVILPGAATYLHSIIPHSDLVMVDNAGHCPMIEAPSKYNKILQKYLQTLP